MAHVDKQSFFIGVEENVFISETYDKSQVQFFAATAYHPLTKCFILTPLTTYLQKYPKLNISFYSSIIFKDKKNCFVIFCF